MNKAEKTKDNNRRGKTWRCLQALLKGKIVNRKTLGDMGIAVNNDSAHSLISTIRNQWLTPVESNRLDDGTCDYFMDPWEIKRYLDPILRQIQREEMREHVFSRRNLREKQIVERVRTNTASLARASC